MSIRVVLFDVDGVLVSTPLLHFEALNLALAESGCAKIEKKQHDRLYNGLSTVKKLEMLAERGLVQHSQFAAISQAKQRHTLRMLEAQVKFDPNIYCLCAGLRAAGLRLGVVSNAVAATVWTVIDKLDLRSLIEIATSNEDGPPKPDPALYALACSRFGVEPKEALAVEDGKYGVESAKAAGCKVLEVKGPADVTPERVWSQLGG